MKHNEYGRSMVEMLGVLVVMGVLAITAVWGFGYAMDKNKANRLYNDAKLAYMSVGANGPYDWTQTEFNSQTGLTLFVRQDKAGGIFVLAETVPNGVCNRISDMAEDGQEVVLYTPMNEPVDCGAEKQDIVFAFGGGEPPLIPCEDAGECPDWYNSYCSSDEEVCLVCELGQRKNNTSDGCVDLCSDRTDIYTQTCTSEEAGANWCCPFDTVCSSAVGKCIDAENVCVYDMKKTSNTTMYYTSTCSYTMAQTEATQMYYTATCGYDFAQSTDSSGNITTSFTKIGNACPENHYCRLTWMKQTWGSGESAPTGFANDYTGEMWGVCVPMSATTANAQPVYPESKNLLTRKKMPCPENYYCRLMWTKEKWESGETTPTGFANDYVGDMFGVCVPMSATTGNAQPVYPPSDNLMSKKTDCPSGQYCNLKWTSTENNCANASIPNDYVGLMYGGCVDMDKVGTAVCPGSTPGLMMPEEK